MLYSNVSVAGHPLNWETVAGFPDDAMQNPHFQSELLNVDSHVVFQCFSQTLFKVGPGSQWGGASRASPNPSSAHTKMARRCQKPLKSPSRLGLKRSGLRSPWLHVTLPPFRMDKRGLFWTDLTGAES